MRSSACTAAFFCALSIPAFAAPVNTNQALQTVNNIVLNDLSATAETEGTLYVGGNYTGSGATVNPDAEPAGTIGGVSGGLIVGGDINATNVNLQSGDAVIGGTISGTLNNNGTGTVSTGVAGIDAAAIATVFQTLSTDLSGIAGTGGTVGSDPNLRSFTGGTLNADNLLVFNISSAILQSGNLLSIDANAGGTTLINVSGTSVTLGINGNDNQDLSNVIFNFFEATTLNITSTFNHSILAPFADVVLQGDGIDGTLVSYNLTQQAEVRPNGEAFTGTLPTAPPVPLPATALLLLGALGGVAVLRRRAL